MTGEGENPSKLDQGNRELGSVVRRAPVAVKLALKETRSVYEELHGSEIRILKLFPGQFEDRVRCRLEKVNIQDAQYEAISYCWGDPQDTTTIVCSDVEQEVTRSLHAVLKHLRYADQVRILWADALCINQKNYPEKAQQVQLMGEIYSRACRVLIWLGEETQKDKGALNLLEKWLFTETPDVNWDTVRVKWQSDSSFVFEGDALSSEVVDFLRYQQETFSSIMHLFLRPWWTRKWIIQELVRAKDAWLVCGHTRISWSLVRGLIERQDARMSLALLRETEEEMAFQGSKQKIKNVFYSVWYNAMVLAYLDRTYKKGEPSLLSVVTSASNFECTVRCDILYSLLGIAKGIDPEHSDLLRVDYSAPLSKVAADFTIYLLYEQPTKPLEYFHTVIGNRRHFGQSPRQRVEEDGESQGDSELLQPSWLCGLLYPDSSNRGDFSYSLSDLQFDADKYDQHKKSPEWKVSSCKSVLSVNGIIVDRIMSIDSPPLYKDDSDSFSFAEQVSWTRNAWKVAQRCAANQNLRPLENLYELITCGGHRANAELESWQEPELEVALMRLDSILQDDSMSTPGISLTSREAASMQASIMRAGVRQFCTTSAGYAGWVPQTAKVGDEICAIPGDQFLYVVSPCGGGYHNLIGPCYVQGLMHGKALDLGHEERWIDLY